jgi:hypothetical protein
MSTVRAFYPIFTAAAIFFAALPAAADEKPASVPLTGIVLFTSGVGYFQHDGTVEGDGRMELQFTADGINDVLKSMILRDFGGGAVSSVTYASQDPLTRTLKSFAVDLTGNPGLAAILSQVRGRAVEISAPDTVRGTVLAVEAQQQTSDKATITTYTLDLLTPQGIRSVALAQVQVIRFLDKDLQAELEEALALIASSKDLDKKKVVLHFAGSGKRRVRVGYIQETPVWKTSYRLAVGEDKTPFLQGWAVVENTSDQDWKDVSLTLVSGRPITFAMDLYTPLYVERPKVQLDLYSSLRPQTYDMAMSESQGEPAAPPRAESARAPAPAPSLRKAAPPPAGQALASQDFSLAQGVAQAARASEVGELFQYAIEKPVSLPRQQSALFPIVNRNITGEKYSIYNESVDPARPLAALKLKNSSVLHLMQGPVTVFDGGTYAGDARITDFPPGAEQLISYAVDLDTEVQAVAGPTPRDLFSVKISKGIVTTTYKISRERDYQARNRGSKPKSLIIEHPFDADWTLAQPRQPMERSRSAYRFLLPLEAGATKKLAVIEERQVDQTVSAGSLTPDAVGIFVRSSAVSQAVKDALAKLLALKLKLSDAQSQRQRLETEVADIYKEQERIRENLGRIDQGSTLSARYVKTLSDQEDRLAKLRDDITRARADEAARQKDVDAFLLAIEVK